MQKKQIVRLAALAGLAGPLCFGLVVFGLTVLEVEFLRSLGWHPIAAPTFDWPSGLALAPRSGWLMTLAFLASGGLLGVFALGMFWTLPAGRLAAVLLGLAGLAMACLASPADPTLRTTAATLAGRLHDLAYVALGLTLFPSMLLWGRAFGRLAGWQDLAGFTWVVVGLAVPSFALKGILIYLFLGVVLVWLEAVALRLWQLVNRADESD